MLNQWRNFTLSIQPIIFLLTSFNMHPTTLTQGVDQMMSVISQSWLTTSTQINDNSCKVNGYIDSQNKLEVMESLPPPWVLCYACTGTHLIFFSFVSDSAWRGCIEFYRGFGIKHNTVGHSFKKLFPVTTESPDQLTESTTETGTESRIELRCVSAKQHRS